MVDKYIKKILKRWRGGGGNAMPWDTFSYGHRTPNKQLLVCAKCLKVYIPKSIILFTKIITLVPVTAKFHTRQDTKKFKFTILEE